MKKYLNTNLPDTNIDEILETLFSCTEEPAPSASAAYDSFRDILDLFNTSSFNSPLGWMNILNPFHYTSSNPFSILDNDTLTLNELKDLLSNLTSTPTSHEEVSSNTSSKEQKQAASRTTSSENALATTNTKMNDSDIPKQDTNGPAASNNPNNNNTNNNNNKPKNNTNNSKTTTSLDKSNQNNKSNTTHNIILEDLLNKIENNIACSTNNEPTSAKSNKNIEKQELNSKNNTKNNTTQSNSSNSPIGWNEEEKQKYIKEITSLTKENYKLKQDIDNLIKQKKTLSTLYNSMINDRNKYKDSNEKLNEEIRELNRELAILKDEWREIKQALSAIHNPSWLNNIDNEK